MCGVGAHHQNNIVENMIGLLTRWARTSLLYAKRRWHQAITTISLPYALKSARARYNQLHLDKYDASPDNKFVALDHDPVSGNKHHAGSVSMVLNPRPLHVFPQLHVFFL